MKNNKGITLIALIITIIVMLILVGISVQIVINSNLIGTAQDAREKTEGAYLQESNRIPVTIEEVTYPSLSTYETGWDEGKEVNFPKLARGMTPVYWDGEGTQIVQGEDEEFNWDEWFDYEAQETGVDGKTSKWANAKTEDGSYWVWIPRFEYKITPAPITTASETNAGTIDVRFISKDVKEGSEGYTTTDGITKSEDGYIIHPAFTSNVDVGGFGEELAGFWVAKYEMSQETSTDGENWTTVNLEIGEKDDSTRGNIATTNAGNTNYVRAVSKKEVSSWRWINVANAYTNAYYYDRDKDSHLIKNSEWGAVVYLAHSQYGRNGTEVGSAFNTELKTGFGGTVTSSTGNATGVYDLSGGAREWVAAFNSPYNTTYSRTALTDNLDAAGKTFASYGGSSTKYATAYYNRNASDIYSYFMTEKVSIPGDAIYEVYVNHDENEIYSLYGWFKHCCSFVDCANPFLVRGGRVAPIATEGTFSASQGLGVGTFDRSFRVVCSI